MNTYDLSNYENKYTECWNEANEFGEHATSMLEVFSEPPNWALYNLTGPSEETEAISLYYSLSADLGGESFFLINKEGNEIETPTEKWINS